MEEILDVSIDNGRDYLFLSSYTVKLINENNILKNFKRYARNTEIKDFTPYKLRHTFAVEAVKRNIDIFTLQRIMGHNNITATRQYFQLNTTDIQKKHAQASAYW